MIKLCTLIEWPNSLKRPQWSRHLSQPTLRREGEKAETGRPKHLSPREKMSGVATNVYLRKTLEKPKENSLWILKMRVQELFTHGEGISTPRTCHKGRQPLIECARHDFKIMYFPFLCLFYIFSLFYVFIFLGSTRVLPLLLRILGCDEEIRPT